METFIDDKSAPSYFASQSEAPHRWLRHYRANRLNRPEPEWISPCTLPDLLRHDLGVSFSHFQLGETGGGTFLIREALGKCSADDLEALQLFIKEEGEHARLLAGLVKRMGGRLVVRHWSHRLFKLARRAGGFHFEIQMLLTAELVGTAYYEMINRGVEDGPVNAAIGLMLRDEASHVAFHLDRMKVRWSEWLPLERTTWELQFQLLVLAALRAAWLDHGRCLRSLGFKWDDFRQRGRQLTINFLDNLRSTRCPRQARSIAELRSHA